MKTGIPVATYQTDYNAIIGLLNDYFVGLYEGDINKLRRSFHEDAWLKATDYRKTRDEWLTTVAARPVPRDVGMAFEFTIQSIEIVGNQAMAKAYVPLLAAHYIDFLGLLKEGGRWRIVNKTFSTVE